jgi:hypothetical protein
MRSDGGLARIRVASAWRWPDGATISTAWLYAKQDCNQKVYAHQISKVWKKRRKKFGIRVYLAEKPICGVIIRVERKEVDHVNNANVSGDLE